MINQSILVDFNRSIQKQLVFMLGCQQFYLKLSDIVKEIDPLTDSLSSKLIDH